MPHNCFSIFLRDSYSIYILFFNLIYMKNLQKGDYVTWMRHDNNQMKGRIVDKFIQDFTRTIA